MVNFKAHICNKTQARLTYGVLNIYPTPPSANKFCRFPSGEQIHSSSGIMPARRREFSKHSQLFSALMLFTYHNSNSLHYPGKTSSSQNRFWSCTSSESQTGLVPCRNILEWKAYPGKVFKLGKKPTCCQQEKKGKQGFSSLPQPCTCAFFLNIFF